MSVDVTSVPPWKQALLEKKRRQEEEEKKRQEEEEARLARMPAWKRDILLKKKQQKNSVVFVSRQHGTDTDVTDPGYKEPEVGARWASSPTPVSPDQREVFSRADCNHTADTEDPGPGSSMTGGLERADSGPSEEHIIPIQQNPWLRTELHLKKKQIPTGGKQYRNDITHSNTNSYLLGSHQDNQEGVPHRLEDADATIPGSTTTTGPGVTIMRHDHLDGPENEEDAVFTEEQEEVEYGHGFVHKLLRKFKHMSAQDAHERSLSPKRSSSTENILGDQIKGNSSSTIPRSCTDSTLNQDSHHVSGQSPGSPVKARSMENILSHLPNSEHGHVEYGNSLQVGGPHKFRSASTSHIATSHLSHQDYVTHDDSYIGVVGLDNGTPRKASSAEHILEEELPRPNIVSATRSIFESAAVSPNSLSARYTDTLSKRKKSPKTGSPSGKSDGVKLSPPTEESDTVTDSGSVHSPDQNKVIGSPQPVKSDINHFHDKFGYKTNITEETIKNIRAAGKSWYFSGTGSGEIHATSPLGSSGQVNLDTDNDRNFNYTDSLSRTDSSAVRNHQSVGLYNSYSSRLNNTNQDETETSHHSISHKNQNNNLLSNSLPNGPQSEIIDTNREGEPSGLQGYKKRNAPFFPSLHTPDSGKQDSASGGLQDFGSEKARSEARRANRLHLNLTGTDPSSTVTEDATKVTGESPGYRDLYLSSSSKRRFPEAPTHHRDSYYSSNKKDPAPDIPTTSPSSADSYTTSRSSSSNIPKESTTSVSGLGKTAAGTDSVISDPSIGSTHEPKLNGFAGSDEKPVSVPIAKPSLDFSAPRNTSVDNRHLGNIAENRNPGVTSLIKNTEHKKSTPPVPPLDFSEARKGDLSNKTDKKPKRPAPTGPGLLLIRPASNLVPSGAQYVDITKYEDVKTGVFEPAKKRPTYDSDDDVPITNIDDVLGDDVPYTNIDDVPVSPSGSPHMEQDADVLRQELSKKYEFIGAGVKLGKSLLNRTRAGPKLRISFNDGATSTYEYPSEQSLLDAIPPQPGDYDYPFDLPNKLNPVRRADMGEDDNIIDLNQPGGPLKSTPGMGSGGVVYVSPDGTVQNGTSGLASYRSKFQVEYQFGMELNHEEEKPAPTPQHTPAEGEPDDLQITPAEDDATFAWSETSTSDMLF